MCRVSWTLFCALSCELYALKYPEREAKKYCLSCKAMCATVSIQIVFYGKAELDITQWGRPGL